MTDITNSDVMLFIKWVTAMHPAIYHLARPLMHGVCRLHEVDNARRVLREYPDEALGYDFIGVLAGYSPGELVALKEEATAELVTDFYAANPRWISVEDRLPEDKVDVLVFGGGNINMCWHMEHKGASVWQGDGDDPYIVTHWMPLPAPPEEP
jgi:hypothetical protein